MAGARRPAKGTRMPQLDMKRRVVRICDMATKIAKILLQVIGKRSNNILWGTRGGGGGTERQKRVLKLMPAADRQARLAGCLEASAC